MMGFLRRIKGSLRGGMLLSSPGCRVIDTAESFLSGNMSGWTKSWKKYASVYIGNYSCVFIKLHITANPVLLYKPFNATSMDPHDG